MGPWYYEVVSFDGDYVNLRRTDIESDDPQEPLHALRVFFASLFRMKFRSCVRAAAMV